VVLSPQQLSPRLCCPSLDIPVDFLLEPTPNSNNFQGYLLRFPFLLNFNNILGTYTPMSAFLLLFTTSKCCVCTAVLLSSRLIANSLA